MYISPSNFLHTDGPTGPDDKERQSFDPPHRLPSLDAFGCMSASSKKVFGNSRKDVCCRPPVPKTESARVLSPAPYRLPSSAHFLPRLEAGVMTLLSGSTRCETDRYS
jgi:hypothetical protein